MTNLIVTHYCRSVLLTLAENVGLRSNKSYPSSNRFEARSLGNRTPPTSSRHECSSNNSILMEKLVKHHTNVVA